MKFFFIAISIAGIILVSCQKEGQKSLGPAIRNEVAATGSALLQHSQERTITGTTRRGGPEFERMGLSGKTYEEITDIIGAWHNEYLDIFYSKMKDAMIKPASPGFQDFLHLTTAGIFLTKGINASDLPLPRSFDFMDPRVDMDRIPYSVDARYILKKLAYLVQTKCESGDETVNNDFLQLKKNALNLPDPKEALGVSIPVSVAIHSYLYWKTKIDTWSAYLGNEGRQTAAKRKFGVGQFVAADVAGGIQGGLYGGLGAGPAGVVAGALVGASASSLLNCFSQAAQWLISWW